MPASASPRFGSLLRKLRLRERLSQEQLAASLNIRRSTIGRIERGVSVPTPDSEFIERLRTVPGFTEADIALLREAAESSDVSKREENRSPQRNIAQLLRDILHLASSEIQQWEFSTDEPKKLATEHLGRIERGSVLEQALSSDRQSLEALFSTGSSDLSEQQFIERLALIGVILLRQSVEADAECPTALQEEAKDTLKQFLHTDVSISDEEDLNALKEKPLPSHYSHTMPEHGSELVEEGRWQQVPKKGVVFQSNHAKLLFDALKNPDHEYRLAAEQAVRGFAETVEKPKGISVNSAAREFNVPQSFLWRWANEREIIPILIEGKGSGSATIIDREKAQEVAALYHEAKQLGIQPIKLLARKTLK